MERESFVFYRDWAEIRRKFPNHADRLMNAIIDYGIYGKEPTDPDLLLCFELVKGQIDRDRTRYEEIVEKRRAAGKKGGAPKGNSNATKQAKQPNAYFDEQNNQMQAKQAKQPDNVNDNDNDNVNDNVNDNGKSLSKDKDLKSDDDNNACARKKSKKEFEDALTRELLDQKESAFWEQAAMGLSIRDMGWDVAGIRRMLAPFQEGNKAKGTCHTDLGNLKRHFYDWLKIQADHRRKEIRASKQKEEQAEKGPNYEYLRKRMD